MSDTPAAASGSPLIRFLLVPLILVALASAVFWLTRTMVPGGTAGVPAVADQTALYDWLKLTAEQRQAALEADPDFEGDAIRLTAQLRQDRADLAALLRQPGVADEAIEARFSKAVETECALEQRVADHVLMLRPVLSGEQQALLLGLIADGLETFAGAHLNKQ